MGCTKRWCLRCIAVLISVVVWIQVTLYCEETMAWGKVTYVQTEAHSHDKHVRFHDTRLQSHDNQVQLRANHVQMRVYHGQLHDNYVQLSDIYVQSQDNHTQSQDNHAQSQDNHVQSQDNYVQSHDNHAQSQDNHVQSQDNYVQSQDNNVQSHDNKCPDVLTFMSMGHWNVRSLTPEEDVLISDFLGNAHVRFRFPPNYEREDKLCGNVTYTMSKVADWMRALCDPKGPTPCCYRNTCMAKTIVECSCDNCFDIRQQHHAEFAKWIPSEPKCRYREHTQEEACAVLSGSTIVFIGDSLVRHFHVALLLLVSGDMQYGALANSASKGVRRQCKGMYIFTELLCRRHIKFRFFGCNGTVTIILEYFYAPGHGAKVKSSVLQLPRKRCMVVLGIGIHADYNATAVMADYLGPLLKARRGHSLDLPKLLWVETHAPGILKSPKMVSQSADSVHLFNERIESFLAQENIPVFRTFNMTSRMMSFDGVHYGLGINVAKANILLSYVTELKNKNAW